MKKILRIINRFNLGGPTYNAAYLTKYLEDDYETLLIGGKHEKSEKSSMHILDNLGLKPIIIEEMQRSIHPILDRIALKKIKDIIIEFKPDIVHTHAAKAGALGRKAAYDLGVKQIYHTFHGHVFHSYFGKIKTNIYKKIERDLAKKSTKIIAISEIQKQELSEVHKICSKEKIEVIPLGFDLKKFYENQTEKRKYFRKKWKIKDDEIAIGIIGRLVPIKNHVFFIDVIEKVIRKSNTSLRIFIVGDGEEKESIIIKVSAYNLDYSTDDKIATIQFTSWIKEIDEVNAGMDIICLCSLNEGTPVSLIEAQASGKPIVTTRTGGIENIVVENKTALISDNNDLNKFTENVLSLIKEKDKRTLFSEIAIKKSKDFDYSILIKNIKKLYKNSL
ncbi:MAG: glycosyltransferase [Flavobacteriales bacterium]|nr:glycosyltransferase [Flavobacteriales bacterium]